MKKLFNENNNGSIKNKKKKNERKNFLNYFRQEKDEYNKFIKHSHKSYKNKEKNEKNTNYKYNFEFKSNACFKIFTYLIIIFIIIELNNIYNARISKRYQYRYQKILENNRTYNESNLLTFEDKLNWLTIHDSIPLKGKCADKIMLHKYSKYILGKDICNRIIKVYDNVKQINFTELPEQFVLKTNHGSSFNFFVYNKTKLNINYAKKQLNKWIHINYGQTGEFYYSYIKRKIFAEEFIGGALKNFKFLCYNGRPKYVYVSIKQGYFKYRNFYDMDWNLLKFKCLSKPHPTYKYKKPELFEQMKEIARKLSKKFKFVRVDLYLLKNKEIRLGELTFIPMNSIFLCKDKEDEIALGKDIIVD